IAYPDRFSPPTSDFFATGRAPIAETAPITDVPAQIPSFSNSWTQPIVHQNISIIPLGNLQATVSENFLNRLIARDEQKPGDVNDFILGARVKGYQITFTQLRFDLLPSTDKMRGALVLHGINESQTTGITPQAIVDVASQQTFVATKDVFFDGYNLSTRPA